MVLNNDDLNPNEREKNYFKLKVKLRLILPIIYALIAAIHILTDI